MADDLQIRIEGLSEFRRALGRIEPESKKQIRIAFNSVAEVLVEHTRPQIPRRSGAAAKSLRAKSTGTSARVSVGGARARYYPWLDFGGRTGIGRSVVRPFYSEGRYLYPTLRKIRPLIEAHLEQGLTAVAEGAGLDVT